MFGSPAGQDFIHGQLSQAAMAKTEPKTASFRRIQSMKKGCSGSRIFAHQLWSCRASLGMLARSWVIILARVRMKCPRKTILVNVDLLWAIVVIKPKRLIRFAFWSAVQAEIITTRGARPPTASSSW